MKKLVKFLCVPSIVIFFTGCSVTPSVKYVKIEKPDDLTGAEFDSYSLRDTEIKIKLIDSDKPSLEVNVNPVEYTKFKVGVIHADSFGITSNINISKLENSSIVSEIGTDVSDKRIETIGKIVSTIGSAFGVASVIPEGAQKEYISVPLKMSELKLTEDNPSKLNPEQFNLPPGVQITISNQPKDSRKLDDLPYKKKKNQFYYSACRTVTVEYKNLKKEVVVSDPNYFQTVGFPLKGKIRMHSECGVSVSSEPAAVSSNADIADAFATQLKALKEILDKKQ